MTNLRQFRAVDECPQERQHKRSTCPAFETCTENKRNSQKMSGHSHGSGGCGGHGHSHDLEGDADFSNQFSLYLKIDLERVTCLNEATDGSGKTVFKPYDQKLDREKVSSRISPM